MRRSCHQLKKSGLLEAFPDKKGNIVWHITEKGTSAIAKILGVPKKEQEQDKYKNRKMIKPPLRWDGKWRLVFFDIPTDFNLARDALRRELRMLGCYQLQRSVLAHPFPCVHEVLEVAKRLNIVRYIEVVTVEDFANKDAKLFFEPLLKPYVSMPHT